jgi:hypothetical protein
LDCSEYNLDGVEGGKDGVEEEKAKELFNGSILIANISLFIRFL